MAAFLPVGLICSGIVPAAPHREVGHEALEAADGHRLQLVADDAGGLALDFLGTDPAADRRQGIGVLEDPVRMRGCPCAPARR